MEKTIGKIVLLTTEIRPFCTGGGAGSFNLELIKEFENNNIDYSVVTINSTLVNSNDKRFYFINKIKPLPFIGSLLSSLIFSFKSRKIISNINPDIILTDDFGGNFFFYSRKSKYKKIIFAHTTYEHINKINYQLNKNIKNYINFLYFYFVEKFSIKKSDLILAPTQYALDIVLDLINTHKPSFLTPLGIENYSKKKNKYQPKIKNIIWAGNITERKGIYRMLDIQNEINKIDSNIKLKIVATTNHEKIYNYINTNNLKCNVEIIGFTPKEELFTLFCDSDLLLLTSYSENFPMILLESAMLKLPFAFIKNGGSESIWSNTEGIIFNKNESIKKIAQKITSINGKELENISLNANQKFITSFSKDQSLKNIINIIKSTSNG